MNYASVCDGIGAVHVAWKPLGWNCAWTSEIEPFPTAVVEQRQGLRNVGDMTKIHDEELADGSIDLLVGGTPCQSFSVAGLRKGLADPRGNLALAFLRLVDRARPRWMVWENVPGVLSSGRGRDFGSFLGALGELGYGWAYRVLDAQYFGLAQRRKRVFVVGCPGDWNRPAAVLLERSCLRGDLAPRREAVPGTAGGAAKSLRGRSNATHREDSDNYVVTPSLTTKTGTGTGTGTGGMDECCVAVETPEFAVTAFDTTQITSALNRSSPREGDTGHPLAAGAHAPAVAYTVSSTHSCETQSHARATDTARCLDSAGGFATNQGGTVVAYSIRSDAAREGSAKTPSADAEGRVRLRDPGLGIYEEIAPTVDAGAPHGVMRGLCVRRLTPRECERLQGFPDDYTLVEYRGGPAKDAPRYKALGNSMAVPVMNWIGRRIEMIDQVKP